jgi:hypothetical protein
MELNKIHQGLIDIYPNDSEFKSIYEFSFRPENYIERTIELLKRGYWSLAPFAFAGNYNFAIRLMPTRNVLDSPIVYFGKNDPVTISPQLSTFIPFFNLCFFENKSFITRIKEKLFDFENFASPFLNFTNDTLALDFFMKFINDDSKMGLLDEEDGYEKIFREFWNFYNDNEEQRQYDAILEKLINKPFFTPDSESLEFGIWNNRMSSILATSALFNLKSDFHDKQDVYWQFLTNSHGIDAVKEIDFVPDSSSNSANRLIIFAEEFDTDPYLERRFSPQILNHPLYDAIQEIRVKKHTYLGEKHVEAAKIFDVEFNDPLSSWNALVSASYWAGKQQNEAVEVIWEAAIYLSEKSGWKEINEILVQQFEFYQKHKNLI